MPHRPSVNKVNRDRPHYLIRARMRDLSAPVALSRKIAGDDRHRWSYVYEWTSDQGVEWALKPPLQSLCGWRRNAQTCCSWSNDQLSSAFTAPAARLSSRTVQQNQKWSPELPYSSRAGPAQQRADDAAKSRHLTSATQVAGAKHLPNGPPPLRRAVRGSSSAAPCDPPTPGWLHTQTGQLGTIASYLEQVWIQ